MTESMDFDAMMDKMAAAVAAGPDSEQSASLQEETKEELITCPCCGQRTLPRQHPIDPVLLDQFMACVITGEPFKREYTLYNGKIKLLIARITDADRDVLRDLQNWFMAGCALDGCVADGVTLESLHNPERAMPVLIMVKRLAVTGTSDTVVFEPATRVYDAYTVLRDISNDIIKGNYTKEVSAGLKRAAELITSPTYISGIHPLMLASATTLHDRIFDMLVEAGFDASFWAGIKFA